MSVRELSPIEILLGFICGFLCLYSKGTGDGQNEAIPKTIFPALGPFKTNLEVVQMHLGRFSHRTFRWDLVKTLHYRQDPNMLFFHNLNSSLASPSGDHISE